MRKDQVGVLTLLLALMSILSCFLYFEIKGSQGLDYRAKAEGGVPLELDKKEKLEEQKERDYIEVGLMLALSGIKSDGDRGALEGAELAIDKLNFEGGAMGREFKLVLFDNRGTPLGSKKAAEQAVAKGVSGVVGPERSSYALAAGPVFQKGKVPMITHLATHEGVTDTGEFIFRACYTNKLQGEKLGTYAIESLGSEKAVVLRMIDEEYSLELSEYFSSQYKRLGGSLVWTGSYKAKDMDYSDIVETITRIGPDLVFIAGYTKDIGIIMKQAKEAGVNAKFLSGDGVGTLVYKFGGEATDGLIASTHWHKNIDTKENEEFLKRYIERYGEEVSDSESAALAYDSVMLIGEAVRKTGRSDGDSIRKQLSKMDSYIGVTGKFKFDNYGDPEEKGIVLIEFKDGKRELVNSISME